MRSMEEIKIEEDELPAPLPPQPPAVMHPITTVTVVDASNTTLPFTITTNTISTIGHWSNPQAGIHHRLFLTLTQRTPLTLPITITIATLSFTILTTVPIITPTTLPSTSSTIHVTPTISILQQNQLHHQLHLQHFPNNNTFAFPIVRFPIEIYLSLSTTVNNNGHIDSGAAVLIRIGNRGVSYSVLNRLFPTSYVAFISM